MYLFSKRLTNLDGYSLDGTKITMHQIFISIYVLNNMLREHCFLHIILYDMHHHRPCLHYSYSAYLRPICLTQQCHDYAQMAEARLLAPISSSSLLQSLLKSMRVISPEQLDNSISNCSSVRIDLHDQQKGQSDTNHKKIGTSARRIIF